MTVGNFVIPACDDARVTRESVVARFVRSVVEQVLPLRCALCGRPRGLVCSLCEARVRSVSPIVEMPNHLERLVAVTSYEGDGKALVGLFKYGGHQRMAEPLSRMLAVSAASDFLGREAGDGQWLVTWAPTSHQRRHERGFDQAELLARGVAQERSLPVHGVLQRMSGPLPQTGRSRDDRHGVRFAVVGSARCSLLGRHVVVVDDVVTTGATMAAAAEALLGGGARSVSGLCIATTPAHRAERGAGHSENEHSARLAKTERPFNKILLTR